MIYTTSSSVYETREKKINRTNILNSKTKPINWGKLSEIIKKFDVNFKKVSSITPKKSATF